MTKTRLSESASISIDDGPQLKRVKRSGPVSSRGVSVSEKLKYDASSFENESLISNTEKITGTESHQPSVRPDDPARKKCVSMFHQTLLLAVEEKRTSNCEHFDEAFELQTAFTLAMEIEKKLHEYYGLPSDDQYKTVFRSKYLNLKDKTNPILRKLILEGDISPESFIKMTSAEMASEERKKEDERINKENLLRAHAIKDNESETDMFQCGRCKQRKCKYYQLQTRSADEPMTTFVTCTNCGHRWKM